MKKENEQILICGPRIPVGSNPQVNKEDEILLPPDVNETKPSKPDSDILLPPDVETPKKEE